MSELFKFVAQNLKDSATEGPNKGKYTETAPDQDLQKVVERNYRMPQNANQSLQTFFDLVNREGTNPQTPEQRAKPGNKAFQVAGKLAEIAIPVAAGIGARNALEMAGASGGPIVAGLVGAVSGGVSGAIKVRAVKSSGEGAKEFYQREVSGKERDLQHGGFFKKARAVVSTILSLPENMAVVSAFNAKGRNKEIKGILKELNLDLNNKDLFENISTLLDNPENTLKVQTLLKNLMTGVTLTGFSEQIEAEDMAKRTDAMNIVTFAMAQKQKADKIQQAFDDSRAEVEKAVKSLKVKYVMGSAVSRAVKSFLFVTLIDSSLELAEKAKEAHATAQNLTDHFNPEIQQYQDQINDLNKQLEQIGNSLGESSNNLGLELNGNGDIAEYARQHLIPAAKSAGFGENVQAYLAAGGQERLLRFESIKQIYTELSQNPGLLTKVSETAQNLGVSNDQVLEAIMTRAPYDLNGVTINGVQGFDYQSVSSWLDKVNSDARALSSLKQGLDASNNNLHSAWRGIWDGLITENNFAQNTSDLDNINQALKNVNDQRQALLKLMNSSTEAIKVLADSYYLTAAVGASEATILGIADVWGSLYKGSVVFGDKFSGPKAFRANQPGPLPNPARPNPARPAREFIDDEEAIKDRFATVNKNTEPAQTTSNQKDPTDEVEDGVWRYADEPNSETISDQPLMPKTGQVKSPIIGKVFPDSDSRDARARGEENRDSTNSNQGRYQSSSSQRPKDRYEYDENGNRIITPGNGESSNPSVRQVAQLTKERRELNQRLKDDEVTEEERRTIQARIDEINAQITNLRAVILNNGSANGTNLVVGQAEGTPQTYTSENQSTADRIRELNRRLNEGTLSPQQANLVRERLNKSPFILANPDNIQRSAEQTVESNAVSEVVVGGETLSRAQIAQALGINKLNGKRVTNIMEGLREAGDIPVERLRQVKGIGPKTAPKIAAIVNQLASGEFPERPEADFTGSNGNGIPV